METPTAQRFGVSRMPVRMAFRTLEQEGLLVPFGGRGYQVRSVSPSDIAGAVEVRGVLEGLAARQTAEQGCRLKRVPCWSAAWSRAINCSKRAM